MKLFKWLSIAFVLSVLFGACTDPSVEVPPEYGNDPGYSTWYLSGTDRLSSEVMINGFTINTSTIDTIRSSVDTIRSSECEYRIVEEIDSQNTDMTIDFTSAAQPVSDVYYGMNLQWNSKYFLTVPKYRELAGHVKFDIARFPGGQERIRYDRSASTSPNDELGMDQVYQFLLTGEDISNFISFCSELEIEAEPEYNLFTSDPVMWADMVDQIVNELGYGLEYLCAGNEPEVNGHGNWEVMEVSTLQEALEKYTQNFLETRQSIEAVKPGIIHSLFEASSWEEPALADNLDTILANLNGVSPGAISSHFYAYGYWQGMPESNPAYPSLDHVVIRGNNNHEVDYLSVIKANIDEKTEKYNLDDQKTFIGELCIAYGAGADIALELQESLASAIYYAEVLEYCKLQGYDSLQYFSFSDPEEWAGWRPALIGVSEDHENIYLRPAYYLYMMYEYFYGDRIVNVSNGRDDDWSVYASKDDGSSYIMLINRTEDERIKKTASVTTESGSRVLELTLHPKSVAIIKF